MVCIHYSAQKVSCWPLMTDCLCIAVTVASWTPTFAVGQGSPSDMYHLWGYQISSALLGRHFTILSDHKSLIHLFASDKLTCMSSVCIQIGSLLLSAYNYSISHQPGKAHANMDTLSRLPLSTTPTVTQPTGDTNLLFACLQVSALNVSEIRHGTDHDQLRTFVLQGWLTQLHITGRKSSCFRAGKTNCVLMIM